MSFFIKFFRKLTFKKICNVLLVYWDFMRFKLTGNVRKTSMPFSLSIEPTNFCNLSCRQCLTGLNKLQVQKGIIDLHIYKKVIDYFGPYLVNLFLYFRGEPFLHSNIVDLVDYAVKKNIFTVISTNGHHISKNIAKSLVYARLDKIIISLDALTQHVYQFYRVGGNVNKVFESIENLLDAKKDLQSFYPLIEVQMVVNKKNEPEIEQVKKFCKDKKLYFKLKTMQIVDFSQVEEFLPVKKTFNRYYKNASGVYELKRLHYKNCFRIWNSLVITWDGQIVPCCYDKNNEWVLANFDVENNFYADNFQNFVQKVKNGEVEMCRNCGG